MNKLLMATGNANKVKEMKEILLAAGLEFEVLTPKDLGITSEPIEDGKTFAENAIIKAEYYHKLTGLPAVADDSGICIDFFDGAPGVYSARFLDSNDYNYKNNYILQALGDSNNRGAQYHCVIAYACDGETKTYEGVLEGQIALEAKGANGFGYDPIFYVPQCQKTTAQMTREEKNAISHRGQALRKWLNDLV